MTIHSVNVQTGKRTSREWTAAEKKSHEDALAAAESKKTVAERRAHEYAQKEKAGELPDLYQNIDELWKALEALAAGDNLPGRAVDIIRTRNEIKARFPKG